MSVMGSELWIPAAAALAGLLVGFALARASGRDRRRIEELEVRVAEREGQIGQLEAGRAELEARLGGAEQERDAALDQLADYQGQVVDHFSQTSELLKEMTLHYRTIYQHLAQGAEALCPEGSLRIESQAPMDALGTGVAGEDGEAAATRFDLELDEDDGASMEAAHCESPLQVDPRPEL